jgi:hypothetical protein
LRPATARSAGSRAKQGDSFPAAGTSGTRGGSPHQKQRPFRRSATSWGCAGKAQALSAALLLLQQANFLKHASACRMCRLSGPMHITQLLWHHVEPAAQLDGNQMLMIPVPGADPPWT